MKVWLVLGGWSSDGYDKPVGVFRTRERAEAALKEAYDGYDVKEIIEYELDSVDAFGSKPAKSYKRIRARRIIGNG